MKSIGYQKCPKMVFMLQHTAVHLAYLLSEAGKIPDATAKGTQVLVPYLIHGAESFWRS